MGNELAPPEMANRPAAQEVLRVWAEPGSPQQFVLQTTWEDPAAWGLLLVDLARHAARAYAGEDISEADAFARIISLFRAELSSPTDTLS